MKLNVVYILASTYDDEGYVLRYMRGILPSNTLTVLKSLTESVAAAGELDEGIEVSVDIYDDTVQRVPLDKIARRNGRKDTKVVAGFVGVQSNQFARATDLALSLRERGVPVMMGGFHVSGMLAMFDEPTPDLRKLLDAGVTLVKGEADAPGALAEILHDAAYDRLKPVYDIAMPPSLACTPIPAPDMEYLSHFKARRMTTLDTSRGCPFNCSFCTIINVQGRRMRGRSAEAILEAVKRNYELGIDQYFFTDDNLSRSPVRDELLDGLAELREQGMDIRFMMQVDTNAYRIPGFVERARKAGCYMVFVGMETVNQENLEATGKVQNDAAEYPEMVRTWHDANVLVHVGYIIGLPYDTVESVQNDVEALMNDVLVDEASFFMLTPLPGSRDHKDMVENGTPLDADLNNYDSLHETFRHPRMAPGTWQASFQDAWERFYSIDHIVDVMLRTPGERYWLMLWTFMWYRYSTLRKSHPMFTGLIRLKDRKSRRPGFPREGVFRYAWRRAKELVVEARTLLQVYNEFQEIWLLTRKPDDPRWAALADLRRWWVDVQRRVRNGRLAGRYDEAAQALREMLSAASSRLRQMSEARRTLSRRARKALQEKAQEAEQYIASLDRPDFAAGSAQAWQRVLETQQYIHDQLVMGYEEAAIRYVASRRRFTSYRQDFFKRLRNGSFSLYDVCMVPRTVAFEVLLGVRFLHWFLFSNGA